MVTTPSTLAFPTPTKPDEDKSEVYNINAADRALHALLQEGALLQSLMEQSSSWVPARRGKVLTGLWNMLSPQSGGRALTKESVTRAVIEVQGSTIEANALWSRLNPDGKGDVIVGDFAVNEYIGKAVDRNIEKIQEAVEEMRRENQAQAAKGGSLLDFTVGSGRASILDFFS